MTPRPPKQYLLSISFLILLVLAACGTFFTPVPTPTLISTPTETPVPLAVSVNGEGISIAEFDAEFSRYQQAQAVLGITVGIEEATQKVLNDFVDTLLLEQGAAAQGFVVDDAALQGQIDALSVQLGGQDVLATWESAHGYSDADFRSALRRQIAAAWMRDNVAASVEGTAEQVHVKQILLYNSDKAQQALGYLQAGWSFEDLAAQYDPLVKGELGWFPRGYLTSPSLEEAAFALQAGQYSAIIQEGAGYHILYVVERDPTRQLSPDALLTLQENALQSWLTQKRDGSAIIYTP